MLVAEHHAHSLSLLLNSGLLALTQSILRLAGNFAFFFQYFLEIEAFKDDCVLLYFVV